MSNSAKRFPIIKAREFAEDKGLQDAVRYIQGLKALPGWDQEGFEGQLPGVRKGKYIQLFDGHGLFMEFRNEYWSREGAPDNPYTKQFYIERALAYDEALRKDKAKKPNQP